MLFYKPADIPKRFDSVAMSCPPKGRWVASEIVEFKDEWRAYIADGEVLGVFCYSDFEKEDVPAFPWPIPKTITAAVDFGMTADGRVLPVEVNDPYAVGWYGRLSQYQMYADFVAAGWQTMMARSRP